MSKLLAPSAISVVQKDVLTDFLTACAGLTEIPIKIYGPQDGVLNNPAPPCIAWGLDQQEGWNPGQRNGAPGTPSALWNRSVPIVFEIFGGLNPLSREAQASSPSTFLDTTDRTEALMNKLVNAFHRRLTHHGYQVLGGGWGPATRTGLGMVYILTVGIVLPVVREDNPVVRIRNINPEPEISHGS